MDKLGVQLPGLVFMFDQDALENIDERHIPASLDYSSVDILLESLASIIGTMVILLRSNRSPCKPTSITANALKTTRPKTSLKFRRR